MAWGAILPFVLWIVMLALFGLFLYVFISYLKRKQ
ncbi:hypothetical protein PTI45_01331 [Paenibacillus nuruki]|uniref:Uncharacterized protein n=1 Tax=Paenibacillus nuruki TaxID=1886670 RepID=A0A1E3L666_9BACL|nr:hypothetical protein PTI45_01331 [Paenibacillus nuruki]